MTVDVNAATAVVLGEQDEITANMFGITAFEGFPAVVADRDYRAKVAALRPGCFRFGGGIAWFAPKEYDPAWYATENAKRDFEQTLLFGARYPFGRFLPVVRELGAEPMLSLGGPPEYLTQEGTNNPSDFDKWAEYCAEYVGLWREFDPNLRLVQIWNEPNASWFRDPRANDKGTSAADLHIDGGRPRALLAAGLAALADWSEALVHLDRVDVALAARHEGHGGLLRLSRLRGVA